MTEVDAWCNHERRWDWHPWGSGCPGEPVERGGVVPITPHFSAALDEIWRLRTQLAHLAAMWESNLNYKSYPKSQRRSAEGEVERAYRAARGTPVWLSEFGSPRTVRALQQEVGVEGMTRAQWEQQTFGED